MRNTLTVRGVEIGINQPKIISSIIEKNYKEILEKAENLREMQIDVVEWRADFYEDIFDIERTLYLLSGLRTILEDIPFLFTFRTKKEGGEKEIPLDDYTALNTAVAKSGKVDMVDVEIFSGDDVAKNNIEAIHNAGVLVVGSYHDFQATPPKDELVSRLRKMQDLGADIPKIAVMPNNVADVLTLLTATNEMYERYANRPIVAISMSAKGVISRLSGEVFGSAMTFGAVGQVSAPGQIPVEELVQALDILHKFL